MVSMKGKHLLTLHELTTEETLQILNTAASLKLRRHTGEPHPLLQGKTLAMIFQKPSLRTRVSFETGMTQLGGHAIYLGPDDISLGKRETTEDIAIVLSRYVDAVMLRTDAWALTISKALLTWSSMISPCSEIGMRTDTA